MRASDAYIKETFARMDLQQIREFLLSGTENLRAETRSYDMWLTQESDPIYNRLQSIYADNNAERDKAASDLSQALEEHRAVYMEIGIKAGARLIYQLLLADDRASESNVSE